jgi:hypothetical protein
MVNKKAIALSALLLLPQAAAAQVTDIVLHPTISHRWALMYREFETEFMDCVYGEQVGDKVYIVLTVPANVLPRHSLVNSVTPLDACPAPGAKLLGVAHSHPPVRETINGQRFKTTNNDECYMSMTDMISFKGEGLPVSIVVCGTGQFIMAMYVTGEVLKCVFEPDLTTPACTTTKLGVLKMNEIPDSPHGK